MHTGWQKDDDLPVFSKIIDILIISRTPLLFAQKFATNGINSHILAYEITPTNEDDLVLLSKLDNKSVYSSHTFIGNSKLYIVMRSYVPCQK